MKNIPILLTLTIVLFSCIQKKEFDNIIDFTSITEPNIANLSEMGSDITYIPLETNVNCLVKQIDKLIYEGESYFLGSINKLPLQEGDSPFFVGSKNNLFRFSKNGEFICQISRQGRSPSEYQRITDFLYNESNNTIEIFSGTKVKEFSLDGIWKKDINIEYDKVASLGYINNQFLGFIDNSRGQNEYSFVLFDENGKVVNKYKNKYKFDILTNSLHFPSECIFYRYDGILYCKELHSDTIFSFDNGAFIPKYILKQGETKFTSDLRKEYIFKNREKIIIQENAFESKKYLFYQYEFGNRHICLIKNKSNGAQYLIDNGTGFKNDIDNGPYFKIQNTVTVDGNEYIVSWINAFELKTHIASDEFKNATPKYPKKKKELEQLANSLDENDNPVLMLVKLKE